MPGRGLSPEEVDRTPMWKLAAFLGADVEREETQGALEDAVPSGGDLIERRLRHARGEGPAPEAAPTPPSVIAALAPGLIGANPPG